MKNSFVACGQFYYGATRLPGGKEMSRRRTLRGRGDPARGRSTGAPGVRLPKRKSVKAATRRRIFVLSLRLYGEEKKKETKKFVIVTINVYGAAIYVFFFFYHRHVSYYIIYCLLIHRSIFFFFF